MTNKIFFFSDIDDTLIQTKRKTDFTKNNSVAAYDKKGDPLSFMYKGTEMFLSSLISSGVVFIPTTARNVSSYTRTVFPEKFNPKYAILNFGGTILIDGEEDMSWKKLMADKYSSICSIEDLSRDISSLKQVKELGLIVKSIDNMYISVYNKQFLDDPGAIAATKSILLKFLSKKSKFYLYENENSFGVLPTFLNKDLAVSHLIEKHSPILTIGAGDNLSDLDFMSECSFCLVPSNSKIHLKTNS